MKIILIKVLLQIVRVVVNIAVSLLLTVLIFKTVGIPDFRWIHKNYKASNISVIKHSGLHEYKEINIEAIKDYNAKDYLLKKDELKNISKMLLKNNNNSSSEDLYHIEASGNFIPQQVTYNWTDDHRGYQNSYIVERDRIKPIYHADGSALDPTGLLLYFGIIIIYITLFAFLYKQIEKILLGASLKIKKLN